MERLTEYDYVAGLKVGILPEIAYNKLAKYEDREESGFLYCTGKKWISVNDRLPEKNIFVLLFLQVENDTRITTGKLYKSDNIEFDGNFCIGFDDIEPEFLKNKCVTHWMPLPEPPEFLKKNVVITKQSFQNLVQQLLSKTKCAIRQIFRVVWRDKDGI